MLAWRFAASSRGPETRPPFNPWLRLAVGTKVVGLHLVELSNADAAQVLGTKPSAVVNRYVGALEPLQDVCQGVGGGIGGIMG